MAKQAHLADGTILEFPDETPDTVMDQAVQQHVATNPSTQTSLAGGLKGAADVAISSARGMAHQIVGSVFGVGSAIGAGAAKLNGADATDPDDPRSAYMRGRDEYMQAANADQLPIRGAQLRTPEGRKLVADVGATLAGNIPGAAQVPKVLSRLHQGAVDLVGPEATDIGETALTIGAPAGAAGIPERLAALRTGGRLTRGEGAAADALAAAERNGYTPTPFTPAGRSDAGKTVYAGTKGDRLAASLGGPETVDSRVSIRNQTQTDRDAAAAIKNGEEFPSKPGVDAAVAQGNAVYDALKKIDVPMTLRRPQFVTEVTKLGSGNAGGLVRKPMQAIEDLKDEMLSAPTAQLPAIVDDIRSYRSTGGKNIASGNPDMERLGHAQRQAADLLEQEVADRLQRLAANSRDPNLKILAGRIYNDFTAARQHLSVLHDVRDAMNATTGSIDAKVIADIANSGGHKLDPNLQKIADAYNTIGPSGMRNIHRAAKIAGRPMTAGDAVFGGIVGLNAAAAFGPSAGFAGQAIGTLAPSVGRLALREYALRSARARAVQHGASIAGRGALAAGVAGESIDPDMPQ